MRTILIESGAKRKRSKAGLAMSVAIHGALIAAALAAGSHVATTTAEPLKAESIEFVAPPPPKPPEEKVYRAPDPPKTAPKPKQAAPRPAAPRPPAPRVQAPRPAQVAAAPAPINVPVITPPVAIPTTIPGPDLNAIPTVSDVVARASDIAGTSSAAKSGSGSTGGTGRVSSESSGDVAVSASRGDGSAWGEEQVDVAVRQRGGVNLKYPERLRANNISGTVMMRFIVGTNGRVEMSSVKVLDSPHDEFTAAVKDALRGMRFQPAEVRGTKVRQLVEQSFTFKLG